MKKWKCSVCGYIHEGNAPPESCPICGATKDKFVEIDTTSSSDQQEQQESDCADVLVVGSGAAAFSAAISARQLGLTVIMLEKADEIGGTTARSGGGFWIPNNRHQKSAGITDNREDGIRYMARYSYPHLYQPNVDRLGLPEREYQMICSYYDHASEMVSFLENCGAMETVMEINWTGKPNVDYMDHLPQNKGIRGRTLYTKDETGKLAMGGNLINVLNRWAQEHGIPILKGHEVNAIVQDDYGQVIGLTAKTAGKERIFKANRGIIFGSGGYSHNSELMLQFQRGPHYGGCAVPSNTGDFIQLAGKIGAAIGNTAGAFRAQSMIEVFLKNPSGSSNVFYIPGDSVIEVNKYGKRVMDEKRNYTDRTMSHFVWDPVQAEWSNMLLFMIWDARTAKLWQGYPPYPTEGTEPFYIISGNTLEELSEAIDSRLTKLAKYTGNFSLSPNFLNNLKDSVMRFNEYAEKGIDLEFGRGNSAYDREWTTFPPTIPGVAWPEPETTNYTMHPLSEKGPYYAVILAAGTLDTNGGPVIDSHARVLDWSGTPIPGLYGAGNCIASPTANAYWGAGSTIGPGMTFGYLAACDIAGHTT